MKLKTLLEVQEVRHAESITNQLRERLAAFDKQQLQAKALLKAKYAAKYPAIKLS